MPQFGRLYVVYKGMTINATRIPKSPERELGNRYARSCVSRSDGLPISRSMPTPTAPNDCVLFDKHAYVENIYTNIGM